MVQWVAIDEAAPNFRNNANVVLESTALEFSDYIAQTLQTLELFFTGFSIVSQEQFTDNDGTPVFSVTYDWQSSGNNLRVLQVVYFDELNGLAFVLTMTTLRERFAEFSDTFDHMKNSFKMQ